MLVSSILVHSLVTNKSNVNKHLIQYSINYMKELHVSLDSIHLLKYMYRIIAKYY